LVHFLTAPPNKRKDLFVVNRWLGLPIKKDMGLFFLCRCLAVNQVLFDLSRSQVDRLSGPLSVHLLESSLGLPLSQSKMETFQD
jgi:hypothetical protein